MISNKAKSLSSQAHIHHSLNIGREAERIFKEITDAIPSTQIQNYLHIDFNLGDKAIDVKGYKKSHESGYILVEFLNVQGKAGWCSSESKNTHIAFQMKDCFILVEKRNLREKCISLCGNFTPQTVLRGNRLHRDGYDKVLYKWLGREKREDVFCYIKLFDLTSLPHDTIA